MNEHIGILIGLTIGTIAMAVIGLISLYAVTKDTYRRANKYLTWDSWIKDLFCIVLTIMVSGVLGFAVVWSLYCLVEFAIKIYWR